MIKIVEKEKIHKERILSCFEFDNGKIVATGGDDTLIKLWSN